MEGSWQAWGVVIGCAAAGSACDQRITKSHFESSARLGSSIAISGMVAVVGAPGELRQRGAAYLWSLRDDVWGPEARLVAPDSSDGDWFGASVAISGDRAVVGAPRADGLDRADMGAAYVFRRDASGSWVLETRLEPSLRQAAQAFGTSVAIDGDVIAIGAPDWDAGSMRDAGAAFVFRRTTSGWAAGRLLALPAAAANDKYGTTVAVAGDRVLVGAPLVDDGACTDCGAVFSYSASLFTLTQTLRVNRSAGERFGSALAAQFFDGSFRLVAGAPGTNPGPGLVAAGAAYFYSGVTTLGSPSLLSAGDRTRDAMFGASVSLLHDQVAVGAPGLAAQAGAAYVFQRSGAEWPQLRKLVPADATSNDRVGGAVAVYATGVGAGASGTRVDSVSGAGAVHAFHGEGWNQATRLVGFRPERESGPRAVSAAASGTHAIVAWADAAEVLRRDALGWSFTQRLSAPADYETRAVAMSTNRLAVFFGRGNPDPKGVLRVFLRASTGVWTLERTLYPDLAGGLSEAAECAHLALTDDTLVLGCARYGGGRFGRVFVHRRVGGVWNELPQLLASDRNFEDANFGISVAFQDPLLVVGERPIDRRGSKLNNGKVYVYERSGETFTLVEPPLEAPVPGPVDRFGSAVALAGDRLAVLQEADSTTLTDAVVRVYRRVAGRFSELEWSRSVPGMSPSLAMSSDRLIVGNPEADPFGIENAGEVLVFRSQPDASWSLDSTEHLIRGYAGDFLGSKHIALSGRTVIAAANGPYGGRFFSFSINP
jgi:hypothetical protein